MNQKVNSPKVNSPLLAVDAYRVADFFKHLDKINRICTYSDRDELSWATLELSPEDFDALRFSVYLMIDILELVQSENISIVGSLITQNHTINEFEVNNLKGRTLDQYILLTAMSSMSGSVLPQLYAIINNFDKVERAVIRYHKRCKEEADIDEDVDIDEIPNSDIMPVV